MQISSVITLVSENPAAHGVFEATTEGERTVFCSVKSVGYQEYYIAREHDLNPTLVFVLADYAEYQGEPVVIYHGERYRVVRTYRTPQLGIELTVERAEPATTEGAVTT